MSDLIKDITPSELQQISTRTQSDAITRGNVSKFRYPGYTHNGRFIPVNSGLFIM